MSDDPDRPGDLHSRLLRSPVGRVMVTIVLLVVGSWVALPNMPAGPFRDQVDGWWAPATEIGLVQDWAVFSPNPRDQSLDVRAEIELSDGEVVIWDVPEFDPVVGAFRQYRWKKWQERVRLDVRRDLWAPTVDWLRRAYDDEPVRITMVRRWINHGPLTANGSADDPIEGWNEFRFCTWPAGSAGDVEACDG